MKEFLKKAYMKAKALLLAILTISALALVSMLIISLIFTLVDREYLFTLDTFWRAFMASGCGVGISSIYKDMIEYLGKE